MNTQTSFDFDYLPPSFCNEKIVVRARSQDPETSQEAAVLITSDQDRLNDSVVVVVEIFRKYGVQGDFQIRDLCAD